MKIGTLLKIFAALLVVGVMIFSGMLAWHIMVEPQGGVFEKIIPNARGGMVGAPAGKEKPLLLPKTGDVPKVDPGVNAFEKAHELIALGQWTEARERLLSLVTSYPKSSAAPGARKILTEMNLDEILSSSHREGKQTVEVKRGDSFFGIARRSQTTLDMIEHLNSMEENRPLQPGQELLVAPLNYQLVLEPQKQSVSLWSGENFVAEWTAREMRAIRPTAKPVKISSKPVLYEGKNVSSQSREYRMAEKTIQIAGVGIWIRPWDGSGEKPVEGILLSPEDMEDVFLLTRVGNEVIVR